MPYGTPGGGAYGTPAQQQQSTSATAVTGFVMSLLFCIPVVSQLGAILFSVIGLTATGRTGKRGRGFAIAGLVLGLLGLLGWGVIVAAGGYGYAKTSTERTMAKQFMTDLSAGNDAGMQAVCDPSVTLAQLHQGTAYLKTLGVLSSTSAFGVNAQINNGVHTTEISGILSFNGGGAKAFTVTFGYKPDGTPVVTWWTVK